MKLLKMIGLIWLPVQLLGQTSAHFGAPKYAPEDGKKLLIIGQDLGAVGGLDSYTNGYVDHLGHVPAGVTTYTSFPSLAGLKTKANWGAGDVHAQAYTDNTDFDHSVIVIGLYMVGQLNRILAGYLDSDIDKLGLWINEQERPVMLRIGYEFDGSWNNYNPEAFQNAWRYIVHAFDRLDVRNVAYVWQSAGINTPNIGRWYPGDEYVNWVAYSYFEGNNPGQNIRTFAENHDKPVMIAEATPRRDLKTGSGDMHWSAWFQPLFNAVHSSDHIKALAYINANWNSQSMWTGQGWGDSRVEVNETVLANWQAEIGQDHWLLASETLFDDLEYQKYQDWVITDAVVKPATNIILTNQMGQLSISNSDASPLYGCSVWTLDGRPMMQSEEVSARFVIDHLLGYQGILIVKTRNHDRVIIRKIWID